MVELVVQYEGEHEYIPNENPTPVPLESVAVCSPASATPAKADKNPSYQSSFKIIPSILYGLSVKAIDEL